MTSSGKKKHWNSLDKRSGDNEDGDDDFHYFETIPVFYFSDLLVMLTSLAVGK